MSAADIWDQFLPGLQPPAAPAPKLDRCRKCGHRIRRPWIGDVGALQADVSFHPTDRPVALALMAAGQRTVYVRRVGKRHTSWKQLDRDNAANPNLAAGDHHLNHVCGKDPAPPPNKARHQFADNPPY